eukprot:2438995-Rhodomonas_salina.1
MARATAAISPLRLVAGPPTRNPSRRAAPGVACTVPKGHCRSRLEGLGPSGAAAEGEGERVRGLIQTLIPCRPPVRLVDEVALAVDSGLDPAIVEGAFERVRISAQHAGGIHSRKTRGESESAQVKSSAAVVQLAVGGASSTLGPTIVSRFKSSSS